MRSHDISPPPVKRRRFEAPRPSDSSKPNGAASALPTSRRLPQTIRIFSWNINGITPYLPPQSTKITSFFKPSDPHRSSNAQFHPRADGLRAFLARHDWPEVLFLQELKIQRGNTKALTALLASLNTPLNQADTLSESRTYTLDAVLPRDQYNARGFQGRLYGVGTILRTDFARRQVACIREVEWDLEGRVSVDGTNKEAKSSRPLALLNIYAVNGTDAPYRCPQTGAVTGGATRHDRKLAFHAALRDECLDLERRGFRVIVAGDLNVARGPVDGHPRLRSFPRRHCLNRADFNAKFFGEEDNRRAGACAVHHDMGFDESGPKKTERFFDGVDVFRAMHGLERRYTYYPRTREWGSSCDRVDMVIVSRALWEEGRVRGTGILDTPQERGWSDHVPLWVEVVVGEGEGHYEGSVLTRRVEDSKQ
ncbi:DNase I-like protein [Corynascus novoguineensis]|uniref:DNase I-like protein n=1 Tax=Corynascus novoguineensis TaxID=1126955 RepID=A0AAN7HRP7_9PEZI|nr:DNase I-like protein [Corynascus novoguineensis]